MAGVKGAQVLVTGGARGIGAACVAAYHSAGAQVQILDKDFSSLETRLHQMERVTCHTADITDEAAVEKHFSDCGAADIIVNCAGIVPSGSIVACSSEEFRTALDVNVTGTFLVNRTGVRLALDASQELSIVNISSVISSLASAPNRLAYATSKAALIGMTKSIALDFVKHSIRCNAICPGTIDTPSLRSRIAGVDPTHQDLEDGIKRFNQRQPIGRMGTPEEIAELVLFVSGNQVPFMTGSVITADGGFAL